jgi:hypothetical protein
MKSIKSKIAIFVLIALTGCQASNFQKPTSLGYVKPDKNKTPEQHKIDMETCTNQARSITDTNQNLLLRIGVTAIPNLNSIIHNNLDDSDTVKQRNVFKNCMNERGYEIIPADDDQTSQYTYAIPSPKSPVKVTLPKGWLEQRVTPNLALGNTFFYSLNKFKDTGMLMSIAKLEDAKDAAELAKSRLQKQAELLTDSSISEIITVNLKDSTVMQFDVTGDSKIGYKQRFTYLINVTKGKDEYIVISFFTLAENYKNNKEEFLKILNTITGL